MSSSLLHQAVELAQAGKREQARQLILQFLQSEPNNEVAWLWLASVATDQAEYVRALNEVLRINPENQRARTLLDEYHQQYHIADSLPSKSPDTPYMRPTGSPSQPPAEPVSRPAADQWVQAPPVYGQPDYTQQSQPQGYAQMQPVYVERERVVEKQRRGCLGCGPGCLGLSGCGGCGCGGCGPGCLLALLILIVIPMVACGALSYSTQSLGPLDLVLGVLPGEFGRKNIEIHTQDYTDMQGQNYTITASVPRSWMLVDPDDPVWEILAEMNDEIFPFDDPDRSWVDEGNGASQHPILLDMNYPYLSEGGALIKLELAGQPEPGDYQCKDYSDTSSQETSYLVNGFCGQREDTTVAYTSGPILKAVDPPAQMRTVIFYTPVSATLALKWTLILPDNKVYEWLKEDINHLILTMKIQ